MRFFFLQVINAINFVINLIVFFCLVSTYYVNFF